MKLDKKCMKLYLVTDRTWLSENDLMLQVEEAIQAGVTFVQLREKDISASRFIDEAKYLRKITKQYDIPFVINDNLNVAIAADADGVHVGQTDTDAKVVREIIGPSKILGVSVQTVEQALLAQENGADYIGVGALFSTSTKLDAKNVTIKTLSDICRSVTIPVVAIGGINKENINQLKGSGVDGVAVISAILAQSHITEATKTLSRLSDELVCVRKDS
ncbi:MAG: thiamine phosphate synthase [Firmicutes bacterium HGW-Firmicutes-7]|nr:MAG: thiamine phosphate synthase [Firmicutes bacterium HGW-Firmicutes-7]